MVEVEGVLKRSVDAHFTVELINSSLLFPWKHFGDSFIVNEGFGNSMTHFCFFCIKSIQSILIIVRHVGTL